MYPNCSCEHDRMCDYLEEHQDWTSWCSVCDDYFHSGDDQKYMDPEIEAQAGDQWDLRTSMNVVV